MYPFNYKWSDVGSWDAVSKIFQNSDKNKKIVQINSNNNFVKTEKRTIATIGVKDLIIVDSDNATLISKKGETEKVKDVVDQLLKQNSPDAIEHTFENRPWGKFENLYNDGFCKLKRIIIEPRKNYRYNIIIIEANIG